MCGVIHAHLRERRYYLFWDCSETYELAVVTVGLEITNKTVLISLLSLTAHDCGEGDRANDKDTR